VNWNFLANDNEIECAPNPDVFFFAQLGEMCWHSLTVEVTIDEKSNTHRDFVVNSVVKHGKIESLNGWKTLEMGSYAHYMGDLLQQEYGADVTLLDISPHNLVLGKNRAVERGLCNEGTNVDFKDRRNIAFVGGYQHAPNVDAVQYFVPEIMPLLRRRLPGVRFYVVGSKPPAEIKALVAEDVIISGFVEDLSPFLDNIRVSVAPLRYGAGIKGKIGTAKAVGLPTVATSLAVEGMSLTNEENILVADGEVAFSDAVARVYEDEQLWITLSHAGSEFADKAWGAEAAWCTLNSILNRVNFDSIRGSYSLSLYCDRREP